jgi:hypothetical protein
VARLARQQVVRVVHGLSNTHITGSNRSGGGESAPAAGAPPPLLQVRGEVENLVASDTRGGRTLTDRSAASSLLPRGPPTWKSRNDGTHWPRCRKAVTSRC